jgi:endoglucanase
MRRMLFHTVGALVLLAGVSACSADDNGLQPGTGQPGGGLAAAGQGTGLGGASGGTTGGWTASGGIATGGLTVTGGVAGSGGTTTGGVTQAGGTTNTGGMMTGGVTSTGGMPSTGGAETGGLSATGGAPSTGGVVVATGGISDTGGASGTGGSPNGGASAGLTAVEAAAAMGKGFNLGQMFESTQHPRTLAKASAKIDAYYERGFRNVRIPITWTENVGGDLLVNDPNVGDVNRSHARLAVIQQVVDHALSKPGLYVVINAHHEQRLKTEDRSWVLERLWQDIVDIFGDRDHRLLFEILNEPHRSDSSAMDPANLRNMTSLAYARIRAVDPERIVVIGGNQWFSAGEMATVWPNLDGVGGGQDPYVMATFHHYDPWTFCGDNQGTYDDPWDDGSLSGPMDTMLAWANSVGNGMPVYIGEWGVAWGSRYSEMDCNNIRAWYQGMHSRHAAAKGIPTSVWDDGGWFKILDHASDSFGNNLVDCIDGECAWTGTDRFNAGCL